MIDRTRLRELLDRERAAFAAANPRSAAAHAAARPHLLGGVPMTWMNMAAGGFPLYLDRARGARVTDLDGHEYVDFALGDTGAMAGHSPPADDRGHRPPHAGAGRHHGDDADRGRRLGGRRAGAAVRPADSGRSRSPPPTPTAGRSASRASLTGRPKILVNACCYHGSVDESFAVLGPDGVVARAGGTSARPWTSRSPPGSRSSTTSTAWPPSSPMATSPSC